MIPLLLCKAGTPLSWQVNSSRSLWTKCSCFLEEGVVVEEMAQDTWLWTHLGSDFSTTSYKLCVNLISYT
jgi:hypothetical protein